MDQTNIEFQPKFRTTITKEGSETVSSKDSGSNQCCATVCITVAVDGTVLPPFFIFKGIPGKDVESNIKKWGLPGCAQPKAWFDAGVGPKYFDQILKPYLEEHGNGDDAVIMLDHYKCHLQKTFQNRVFDLGCDIDYMFNYIPAGYTCVLQPIDVGYNAPLKCRVESLHG
jgi:DDE superfamily endonuclease